MKPTLACMETIHVWLLQAEKKACNTPTDLCCMDSLKRATYLSRTCFRHNTMSELLHIFPHLKSNSILGNVYYLVIQSKVCTMLFIGINFACSFYLKADEFKFIWICQIQESYVLKLSKPNTLCRSDSNFQHMYW